MALDGPTLAALIKSNIQAITDFPEPGISPVFSDDRVLTALADAIVSHIVSNGVVTTPGVQSGMDIGTGTIS